MHWLKRERWKAGIALVGMLLLLVLMVWVPVSAVSAYEEASGLTTPVTGTVQVTPTVDATVTALNKEKLAQEVAQQQHTWENWLWGNTSALVIVLGGLFGLWRWLGDQRSEREKRAEERLKERFEALSSIVTGLGDEKEGARLGAAILLQSFLRPGYEQFYIQVFNLAVANLRLPRTSQPSEDTNTALPLTALRQALITVFVRAFILVRDEPIKERKEGLFAPQYLRDIQRSLHAKFIQRVLDARYIQLDNAYLWKTDLRRVWMAGASLRGTDLVEANLDGADLDGADLSGASLIQTNLSGANFARAHLGFARLDGANLSRTCLANACLAKANLTKADLHEADLHEADLRDANLDGVNLLKTNLSRALLFGADLSGVLNLEQAILQNADLRGVIELTKEQKDACKAKGAIIDEDTAFSPPQSSVSPSPPSQSNDTQASSAPSTQVNTPPPDADGSSTTPSKPSNGTQAPSAPSVQESLPTPDTDGNNAPSSKPSPGT